MDLIEIRRLLTAQYGQKFALGAHSNTSGNVDKMFLNKIETSSYPGQRVVEVLTLVARENRIKYGDYDPDDPKNKIVEPVSPKVEVKQIHKSLDQMLYECLIFHC